MKIFALAVALMFSASAFGSSYNCVGKGQKRDLLVTYADAVKMLPCEVQIKRNDGTTVVVYTAKNTVGYCDAKADQMAQELVKKGMTCTAL